MLDANGDDTVNAPIDYSQRDCSGLVTMLGSYIEIYASICKAWVYIELAPVQVPN